MRRRGVLDAQASGSARQRRPIAASRSLTGAAVQLPQTGRSCLAQRDSRQSLLCGTKRTFAAVAPRAGFDAFETLDME